jgi:thymidylate synthase
MTEEKNYLNALRDILENGKKRETRNATTISKFGITLNFDISTSFPLLTTKRMFWKGIYEELLWFIKGNTNSKDLENKGVNIWSGNSSRNYLDSIGLVNYEEGDCGPIYGFQWRHYNADYKGFDKDYSGKGIDQLQNCIDLIKNDPTSRRIYMTAWNPIRLSEMCLPPCHVSYQFYVYDNKLSCMMYQRSGDMFLGVPFNIASTALLTYMICHVCELSPGSITLVIGDAHIYEAHIDAVNEQLTRTPLPFPTLSFKNNHFNINDILAEDIELNNYTCLKGISAKMIP